MLDLFAWLSGAVSGGVFAWLALRASLLYRRAQRMRERAENSKPSQARAFFENFSTRLRLEAGWRPKDHGLIVVAILSLLVHQLLSGIRILS